MNYISKDYFDPWSEIYRSVDMGLYSQMCDF